MGPHADFGKVLPSPEGEHDPKIITAFSRPVRPAGKAQTFRYGNEKLAERPSSR